MRKGTAILLLLTILFIIPMDRVSYAKADNTVKVMGISQVSSQDVLTTKKQVTDAIKKGLLNRKERIQLKMTYSVMKKFKSMNDFLETVEITDDKSTAKDGDYLQFSIKQWYIKTSWIEGGDATVTLDVVYKCSYEEEKKVDKTVKSALKSLELDGKSDYEKVKAIHDYIINKVSYDATLRRTSAYDALIGKSSVCEGYAMAAYRMFTEAGLDTRIITGAGNGASHAWNIVKVEGKWYNIDLTWDDPITYDGEEMLTYDYFLKSNKEFSDHRRDAEYSTDQFQKEYSISKASYAAK